MMLCTCAAWNMSKVVYVVLIPFVPAAPLEHILAQFYWVWFFDKATKMLISIFADRLPQQAHFNTICYLAPLWFSCNCPGVLKELLCYTPTFLHQQYDNYMLSLHARPSGICHVYLMFDFNFSKHSNQLTSPALK